jgi:2-polyprenyl-3-methyl-5-hydroxy-6-metoxy-1,4-benzoquinol methylase
VSRGWDLWERDLGPGSAAGGGENSVDSTYRAGHRAVPSRYAQRLETCIARIAVADHARALAWQCGLTLDYAKLLLDTYCNEARIGLALVEPSLKPGLRILEVGSGIGLLASALVEEGVDIVGIEPGAAGFGFMPALALTVSTSAEPGKSFAALPIGVTELDPRRHGRFDLIYSVNVLEHLTELDAAIAAMTEVLVPGGDMVHMCPNYAVPYEPHFTIPLVPGAPGLTKYIFPRRVRRYPGLWKELNFITAGRLRRLAKQNGLAISFDRGVMGDMVRRILNDPILANRQGLIMRLAARLVRGSGTLALVDRIPPGIATPMVARFRK